jgi:radical SAM superfamily enzyme YgiQ (UPF0313 family)
VRVLRVALVNPPPIAIVEPWFDRPDWARDSLAYLAAYLRQYEGFEIVIIDAKFQRLDFQAVLARLLAFRPDVVGLCALTNEIKPAAYMAALIKERLPKTVTVVGGAHCTAIPQATLREFPSFDLAVVGEGEVTFYELCEALRIGDGVDSVRGLCYRQDGQELLTPPRERILDQDSIPHPAFDLLPPADEYWIQTLRGCPFNCQFCMNHNGRVARKRSVATVMEEIEQIIDRYHPRQLHFGDEIFTVDMERSHALLDAMIERDIPRRVRWECQTHVRFVDYELLKKMKAAGCVRVDMGIESGDEDKLRVLGKGTTVEMIKKAFDAARKVGLPFGTLLIIGHPNETVESMKKTIDLGVELNPHTPFISVMMPFPGTEISRMAAAGEAGYSLLSTDWDEYSTKLGSAAGFAGLSPWQIARAQLWGYIKIFLYNGRLIDLIRFCWQYRWAGMGVLLKVLFKRPVFARSKLKPADYQERLRGGIPVTARDLVEGRADWESYQKSEMRRTRRSAPELLHVITVR